MLSQTPEHGESEPQRLHPRRADPSAAALREAQRALAARSLPAICGLGVLATAVLAAGAASVRTALPLSGAVPLLLLMFGLPMLVRTRLRLSVGWAAAAGLLWLTVILALPGWHDLACRVGASTGSAILLGAASLAAPDLFLALSLALPAAAAFTAVNFRLPHDRSALLSLLFPICMVAVAGLCHRRAREHLMTGLHEKDRRELVDRQLQQIETAAGGIVWTSDAEGRLTRLTGRTLPGEPDQPRGRPGQPSVPPDLDGIRLCALPDRDRDSASATARLDRLMKRREAFSDVVLPVSFAGASRWLSLSGRPAEDALGRFAGYEGVALDVTAVHDNERRIAELAYNDPLTGLPNRESFSRRTEEACRAQWQTALICVSLDDFEAINNTLGTEAGDQLLIAFARRLRNAVRASDFVARLGGGEFGVLTTGLDPERVVELASRIGNEAGAPYRLDEFDAEVASAIHLGISLAPAHATDAQSLARNASLALARARRDNLDRPCLFESAMLEALLAERALASDLRQALARAELSICYHPIVDLETGTPVSAEALLRWRHPTRGEMPPSQFVPIAESSGTIVQLGRFALTEACREAASWQGAARVAVNVSPAQFRDEALLASVDGALAQSGLPPSRLDIEITESVLLDAGRSTLALLRALKERGIRIALDDFGTGYSSLRYLRSFPFDKVKIDASFVRDMTADRDAAAIVRAIIELSRDLGMRTLAEGVETQAQVEALRHHGCHEGQGYLFSRVLEPVAAAAFMQRA